MGVWVPFHSETPTVCQTDMGEPWADATFHKGQHVLEHCCIKYDPVMLLCCCCLTDRISSNSGGTEEGEIGTMWELWLLVS